jgi:RNA-splicing ligase RtcB
LGVERERALGDSGEILERDARMIDAPVGTTPVAIFGSHEEKTLAQLRDVASRAERAALMADGHMGYVMPIGGVAAYRDKVSVVGVGFDIACGNAAIMTDRTITDYTRDDLESIATEIQRSVSFGMGRKNVSRDAPRADELFDDAAWSALPQHVQGELRDKARNQLGTVGSGNHYVDVFADEDGRIWVGVHFGSRIWAHRRVRGDGAVDEREVGHPRTRARDFARHQISAGRRVLVPDGIGRQIRLRRQGMGGAKSRGDIRR